MMLLKLVIVLLTLVGSSFGISLKLTPSSNPDGNSSDADGRPSRVTEFDQWEVWEELGGDDGYDENVNELVMYNNEGGNYTKIVNLEPLDGNVIRQFESNYDLNLYDDDNTVTNNTGLSKTSAMIKRGKKTRVKRYDDDTAMDCFIYMEKDGIKYYMHHHQMDAKTYESNMNCSIQINATSDDMIIELTFVDIFGLEPHPDCAYDYLEIRDGLFGYNKLIGKVCGTSFPPRMVTTGPNVWIKFFSDEAIENEGFKIRVDFVPGTTHRIPEACFMRKNVEYGEIGTHVIDPVCKLGNANQALDVLWTIRTSPDTLIYLNFTQFQLGAPNECKENVVEVFGYVLEESSRLAFFCGTTSHYVTTKTEGNKHPNIMYVRIFATKAHRDSLKMAANFNAYRYLDASKKEECLATEFSCEDNTCISRLLMCDNTAHCRLKTDEDERCTNVATSTFSEDNVFIITIIFGVIMCIMVSIFSWKFFKKVYDDYKIIREQQKMSCDERLVDLGSRLTMDPKLGWDPKMGDGELATNLERENINNEFKKQRDYPKTSSTNLIDHETLNDIEEEPWRREIHTPIREEQDLYENSRRTKESDTREEIRDNGRGKRDSVPKKKEWRDVSVLAADVKEFGCQTRDSLFLTEPARAPSSIGSRGRSGSSQVTLPPPMESSTAHIVIELLKQVEPDPEKSSESRPTSSETTRSAPDVIIVSPT